MKILILIPHLGIGGAEVFVGNLLNQMAEDPTKELSVITFYPESRKGFKLNNRITQYYLKKDLGFSLLMFFKVYKLIKKINPDIVHTHLRTIVYVIPASFFLKEKLLHTIHTIPENESIPKPITWILKMLYKSRIKAITLSDFCSKSFEKKYGLETDIIIANGVAPYKKKKNIQILNELNSYTLNEDNKRFFFSVGRMVSVKNFELLIKAFNILSKKFPHYYLFMIYATRNKEDKQEEARLKELAGENIKFLGYRTNVRSYLQCADAFCLSSVREGLSISLLEAMSLGVIPICTPVGGNVDVLTNAINGFLSEDLSVPKYLNALENYANLNLEELEKIKSKVLFDYNTKYSLESSANKHFEAYRLLLDE